MPSEQRFYRSFKGRTTICNKMLRLLAFVSLSVGLMSAGTALGFNAGKDPSLVGWWK
jgi:hypothetical protein